MDNLFMYMLTTERSLVSLGGLYELGLALGPFCLDLQQQEIEIEAATHLAKSNVSALEPRRARPRRACLQTCCHHLQEGSYDEKNQFYCKNSFPLVFRRQSIWKAPLQDVEFALVHKSIDSCEINRHNSDGHVLDMRDHNFILYPNGNLAFTFPDDKPSQLHSSSDYCLAFTSDTESEVKAYARLCPMGETEPHGLEFLYTTAYPICCTISNVFLFLTFTVYILLPELRAPLFGKITMCFIFWLFFAYCFISAIAFGHLRLINNRAPGKEYSVACKVLGFLVLFSFHQTFFWMNVLSYDIYRKFTRVRSSSSKLQDDSRRMFVYSVYATSIPVLFTLLAIIVEFLPSSYKGIRPGFGLRRCFFDTSLSSFIFFHLFLLIIQVSNIVFFVLTIKTLWHTWKRARQLKQQKSTNQEQIKVILKLFVVMGVTWLSEFLCFLFGWIFGQDVVWKYFAVNDVINMSQGILIFMALVCKRSVMDRLRVRLGFAPDPGKAQNRLQEHSTHRPATEFVPQSRTQPLVRPSKGRRTRSYSVGAQYSPQNTELVSMSTCQCYREAKSEFNSHRRLASSSMDAAESK